MIKHILVAYDLSPLSDRAVERGFKLAEEIKAKLTVLHIVEPDIQETDAAKNKAYNQIELMLRDFTVKTKVDANYVIINVDPVETILSYATQKEVDLIILCLHKKSITDWFSGSTAEKLIRKSTFPILTVQNKPVTNYDNVIAAV